VAASDLPGERAWPTQPVPLRPAPFARQRLTEADLTDRTPAARAAVLERFRTLRAGGLFTPPSLAGTVVFPGLDGGGEWGGAAVDRRAGVLYVNGSDVPWIARMVPSGAPTVAAGPAVRRAAARPCTRRPAPAATSPTGAATATACRRSSR
jgi:quinoprotein glucose dehydrogenase